MHAAFRPALLLASIALLALAPSAVASGWSGESLPSGLSYLGGVSCAHAHHHLHCVAVGQDAGGKQAAVVTSSDGGDSWSRRSVPSGVRYLDKVSCADADRCWAAGSAGKKDHAAILASENGGKTWHSQDVPPGQPAVTWISCMGERCVAGALRFGNALLVTADGGAKWSRKTLPLSSGCTGLCAAYDADGGTFASSDTAYAVGGWQCGGGPQVTECPGVIWRSRDGGQSWKIVFDKEPFVDAIGCVGADSCWAAAATFKTGVMLHTANGGKTWHRQDLPKFKGFFNDIACARVAKADHCVAVGQKEGGTAPVIASTSNGGADWKLEGAPSAVGPLFGVDVVGRDARAVGQNADGTKARAIAR